MDEPFGALDPVTRALLQLELKRVHQLSGKTIVLVTHDIDEALLLGTRIVLMNDGQIVQAASPLALLTRPVNDLVADFMGRSDRGIKLLSLQSASTLARAEPALAGENLPFETSLREAVSFMALHQVAQVNLLNEDGQFAGVLHAADIFAGEAQHPAHEVAP